MSKSILFVGMVMAVFASLAMAAPSLQDIGAPIDGHHTSSSSDPDFADNTITRPLAITPDGAYVGGNALDGSGNSTGFLYEVATDQCRNVYGGGYNTDVTGVGYTASGAIMANGKDSGWNSVNISADGGANWSKKRYTNIGPYSLGSFNTAAGVPSVTNSGGNGAVGNTYATMYDAVAGGGLYAGGIDAADGLLTLFNMKNTTSSDKYVGGISSEGVAVGERDNHNYVVRLDQSPNAAYFRGLGAEGDNNGRAYDISDDGAWAVGYSDGGSGNRAYLKDMSDLAGLAIELPGLPGATYTYAYGISGDGSYAVGISNGTGLGEQAILWDLTGATPVAIHLNTFFTNLGLMGDFTDLFKPYSVGVNASGEPVVSGRGTVSSGAEVGWVATVPEPATFGLLLLGLPLMLRRRR